MKTIPASQFIELHHKGNNEIILINRDNITSVAITDDATTRINMINGHYILVDEDYLTVKGKLVDNVVISADELLT